MSAQFEDVTITEDWLRSVGFKWHQLDRQPHKQWLLWLGWGMAAGMFSDSQDLGIEVAPCWWLNDKGERFGDDAWHCWMRSDFAGKYGRFLHVRHIARRGELIALVEALTGLPWAPENHFYGQAMTPERADHCRKQEQRLDRIIMRESRWNEAEKDDTLGGALPEHLLNHIETNRGKS